MYHYKICHWVCWLTFLSELVFLIVRLVSNLKAKKKFYSVFITALYQKQTFEDNWRKYILVNHMWNRYCTARSSPVEQLITLLGWCNRNQPLFGKDFLTVTFSYCSAPHLHDIYNSVFLSRLSFYSGHASFSMYCMLFLVVSTVHISTSPSWQQPW